MKDDALRLDLLTELRALRRGTGPFGQDRVANSEMLIDFEIGALAVLILRRPRQLLPDQLYGCNALIVCDGEVALSTSHGILNRGDPHGFSLTGCALTMAPQAYEIVVGDPTLFFAMVIMRRLPQLPQ